MFIFHRSKHLVRLTQLLGFLIAGWLGVNAAFAAAPAWKPDHYVEIIVGTAAGSGSDATARLIQKILRDKRLVEVPINVVNKPGGGGMIALSYLSQNAGSGHHLFVTSPTLLTNHLLGKSTVSYADLTPLAQVGSEYVLFSVRADSPLKSGKDLIARLKQDAAGVSFALANALGNHNHMAIAQLANALGVDTRKLKVVVFNASSEGVTALLGGHVDVVASPPSSVAGHIAVGKLRPLAVASERRLSGVFAAVPTWSEQGVKVISANWRSVVGPKGMSEGQIQYWDAALAKLVQQDEWKKDVETQMFENTYLNSADTRRLMDAQYIELGNMLHSVGMVK